MISDRNYCLELIVTIREEKLTRKSVVWLPRVAVEIYAEAGPGQQIHEGVQQASRLDAMAEAQALAAGLGDSVLWISAVRIPVSTAAKLRKTV